MDDPKLKLNGGNLIEGYEAYWSCSTDKKGYSGTAVFVKQHGAAKQKKQAKMENFFGSNKNATSKQEASANVDSDMIPNLTPMEVSYKMGNNVEANAEGRIITLDFPLFSFSNVYVPNSGQNLDRLTYRTQEWDKDLLNFMQTKQSDRGVPVIWLGDLNVAHTHLDVWNDGASQCVSCSS
jgi:exonuclease III